MTAGRARIGQARVTVSGGVDPAVARAAAERAFTALAGSGLPGRGRIAGLRVDVRVPHRGEHQLAQAIAAAVETALRREAGR